MRFLRFLRIVLFAPSTFIKEYIVPDNKEKPYLELGAWMYWGGWALTPLGVLILSLGGIKLLPFLNLGPIPLSLASILAIVLLHCIKILSYKVITFWAGKTLTVRKIHELIYYKTIAHIIFRIVSISILIILLGLLNTQYLMVLIYIFLITVIINLLWDIYFFYKLFRIPLGASKIRATLLCVVVSIFLVVSKILF